MRPQRLPTMRSYLAAAGSARTILVPWQREDHRSGQPNQSD